MGRIVPHDEFRERVRVVSFRGVREIRVVVFESVGDVDDRWVEYMQEFVHEHGDLRLQRHRPPGVSDGDARKRMESFGHRDGRECHSWIIHDGDIFEMCGDTGSLHREHREISLQCGAHRRHAPQLENERI